MAHSDTFVNHLYASRLQSIHKRFRAASCRFQNFDATVDDYIENIVVVDIGSDNANGKVYGKRSVGQRRTARNLGFKALEGGLREGSHYSQGTRVRYCGGEIRGANSHHSATYNRSFNAKQVCQSGFHADSPARKVPVKEHKLALSMSIYSNLGQYKYDFYAFIPHKLWNLCVN
jgi:hypothetical protein